MFLKNQQHSTVPRVRTPTKRRFDDLYNYNINRYMSLR